LLGPAQFSIYLRLGRREYKAGLELAVAQAGAATPSHERSMSDKRWPYIAAVTSIILAIVVAYLVERKCQRELAFQRSFPSPLSELIVGSEPIRCWFTN